VPHGGCQFSKMVGLCEPEDTAAALAAVASNQISLLQTYLASGVDVNAFHAEQSSGQQRTLLHVAAFHGCVEVLEYLLGAGADPNIQSPSDACSPLHAACEGASARCYEAIELLLKAGANKEATDQRGRQPIDLLLTTANPGSDAPVEPAQGSCGMHVPREVRLQATRVAVGRDRAAADLRGPRFVLQGDEPASSELNKPEYCTDEARMYMFKVIWRCSTSWEPAAGPGAAATGLLSAGCVSCLCSRRCPFQHQQLPALHDLRRGSSIQRTQRIQQRVHSPFQRPMPVCTHDPALQVADCPHMDPHDWTECPFAHPGEMRPDMARSAATCRQLCVCVCHAAGCRHHHSRHPQQSKSVAAEGPAQDAMHALAHAHTS
jgi:hypothetical protein